MTDTKLKPKQERSEQEIDLQQLVEQYAFYWKWFLLSLVLALCGALFYLWFAPPVYQIDAKILLQNEDKASGELAGLTELSALTGAGGASAFVVDQIDVIKSRRLARNVVIKNELYTSYYLKDGLKSLEVLKKKSPVHMEFPAGNAATETVKLKVELKDNQVMVNHIDSGLVENVRYGSTFDTEAGKVRLVRNEQIPLEDSPVEIVISPLEVVVDKFQKALEITPNTEKQSYIVNFSTEDAITERAITVVNNLIETYNTEVSQDKSKITRATSTFIDSR